ncbi:unnamed protein product, partial [Amoebophrya sp. A25]|eukprot:GSA25T00021020001.1
MLDTDPRLDNSSTTDQERGTASFGSPPVASSSATGCWLHRRDGVPGSPDSDGIKFQRGSGSSVRPHPSDKDVVQGSVVFGRTRSDKNKPEDVASFDEVDEVDEHSPFVVVREKTNKTMSAWSAFSRNCGRHQHQGSSSSSSRAVRGRPRRGTPAPASLMSSSGSRGSGTGGAPTYTAAGSTKAGSTPYSSTK